MALRVTGGRRHRRIPTCARGERRSRLAMLGRSWGSVALGTVPAALARPAVPSGNASGKASQGSDCNLRRKRMLAMDANPEYFKKDEALAALRRLDKRLQTILEQVSTSDVREIHAPARSDEHTSELQSLMRNS